MYRVCEEIHFCYGHRLLNYEGPCGHPHGHSARAEIIFGGDRLDERGILFEFGEMNRILKDWIEETLDHKMLLQKGDPLILPLRELQEPFVLFETNPTAEAVAKMIFEFSEGKKLPVEEVRVWETHSSWAAYRK